MIIPIYNTGGLDIKTATAIGLVFVGVGILLSIIGFIYDGIKYGKWTLKNSYMNGWKFLGYLMASTPILIALGMWLVGIVKQML